MPWCGSNQQDDPEDFFGKEVVKRPKKLEKKTSSVRSDSKAESRPSLTKVSAPVTAPLAEPVKPVKPEFLPERFTLQQLKDRPLTDGLTYRVKEILERRDKMYPGFKKPDENVSKVKELEKQVAALTSQLDKVKAENDDLVKETKRLNAELDLSREADKARSGNTSAELIT